MAQLAIPRGSLVVVTGANGFIGSHIVDQLLQAGYHVRGTVRDSKQAAWMDDYFGDKYGPGKLSLVDVADMSAPGAFDDAVKGASGLVHVASPMLQFIDPNEVVPMVVNGTIVALEAALTEPSIKRVVITSSSLSAAYAQPNKEFIIDERSWNEDAVKAAWAPPPYEGMQRRMDVYSASKTQAEQAAWKWMEEHHPPFVLNAVLPIVNMGPILSPKDQGYPSTSGWAKAAWDGFKDDNGKMVLSTPSQYFVNVQDNARVHVAALIYSDVKAERLFAYAHTYSWNTVLGTLRKLYPQRKFIEDIPNLGEDKSKVANQRAEELLKRLTGLPGWTSLEQTLKDATATWT